MVAVLFEVDFEKPEHFASNEDSNFQLDPIQKSDPEQNNTDN